MRKRLPIKVKIALWYGSLTLILLCIFLPALILTTRNTLILHEENELRQFADQLFAQIETKEDIISFENEVPLPNDISYLITINNNKVLAQAGDASIFVKFPWNAEDARPRKTGSISWLIIDKQYQLSSQPAIILRIARSLDEVDRVTAAMKLISLLSAPFFLAIAILGGLVVAGRSLAPIKKVIKSSHAIAGGNLSERIAPSPGKDEIGELIQTINTMTDSLEVSFSREKQFTADASHELRTPISIIMAYAETLLAGDLLQAEDRKAVETILYESQRMRKIITQLLALNRGSEGRYPVQMETLNLSDLITGVTAQLMDSLSDKQINLNVNVPPGMTIYGDQSLLTQMLLNLVENAVRYNKNHGSIHITAFKEQGSKIVISDTGIGISKENIGHIFERFFRADAVRDRSGSGLGLSIVKWIVTVHHGKIDVQSELGAGTVCTVYIPPESKQA